MYGTDAAGSQRFTVFEEGAVNRPVASSSFFRGDLTAEIKTEEFVAGKGVLTKWERIRRQNHWFDALHNACAAGYGCGVRLVQEQLPPPPPPRDDEIDVDSRVNRYRLKDWQLGGKRWSRC